jgi:hypothetical protein
MSDSLLIVWDTGEATQLYVVPMTNPVVQIAIRANGNYINGVCDDENAIDELDIWLDRNPRFKESAPYTGSIRKVVVCGWCP